MTFSEAYEEWHPEKLRVVKMTTMAAYDLAYRTHLRPAFGSADVDCIRRRDMQRWAYAKLDAGLAVKTVRDLLAVLKMVLRWVSEEYEIPVDASWRMEWPTNNIYEGGGVRRYSVAEVTRIIAEVQAHPSPPRHLPPLHPQAGGAVALSQLPLPAPHLRHDAHRGQGRCQDRLDHIGTQRRLHDPQRLRPPVGGHLSRRHQYGTATHRQTDKDIEI